ncbi:MAG TPA: alpha/beta fold hydrolase [Alphaproteobacteria bacterium]|nr:alpha/beta fold hydrolase [Alphaproteobacteria bacterium]
MTDPGLGRAGPRPLALHLATAALTWTGAVLPGGAWMATVKGTHPVDEVLALAGAAERRFRQLLDGIAAYQSHPYRRTLSDPPAVWRAQGIRVLDYGDQDSFDRPPLVVIPSLINRHYILDLQARQSFMRYLARAGFRPFLVAWEDPGPAARFTTIDGYVAVKLDAALAIVRRHTGQKPVIMGYCLGGLLALALATRRPHDAAGLVCMATPWDFHADKLCEPEEAAHGLAAIEPLLQASGCLPVDWVQTMFYALDPFRVIEKFLAFAKCDPATAEAEAFVALEDWINDGISMPAPVARTLIGEWYGANTPGRGVWTVAGQRVRPEQLAMPALIVMPERDRIVPPASAQALATVIPAADTITVPRGHIGMLASRSAPTEVWEPLIAWLRRTCQ